MFPQLALHNTAAHIVAAPAANGNLASLFAGGTGLILLGAILFWIGTRKGKIWMLVGGGLLVLSGLGTAALNSVLAFVGNIGHAFLIAVAAFLGAFHL